MLLAQLQEICNKLFIIGFQHILIVFCLFLRIAIKNIYFLLLQYLTN